MIREYDPATGAREPAVLVLGYAILGDVERARILAGICSAEERLAHAEQRLPRHDDHVKAWYAQAHVRLDSEGIFNPSEREIQRKLGLIREGVPGNAPKPLAELRTLARVDFMCLKVPLREEAKAIVADQMRSEGRTRSDNFKTVENHVSRGSRRLAMENALQGVSSWFAYTAAGNEITEIVRNHTDREVEAFEQGVMALSLVHPIWLAPKTLMFLENVRAIYSTQPGNTSLSA